jgi:hypothetical protein
VSWVHYIESGFTLQTILERVFELRENQCSLASEPLLACRVQTSRSSDGTAEKTRRRGSTYSGRAGWPDSAWVCMGFNLRPALYATGFPIAIANHLSVL